MQGNALTVVLWLTGLALHVALGEAGVLLSGHQGGPTSLGAPGILVYVAVSLGAQQQRLRFAMAMLPDPGLLILDEPTTGMDVEGRRDFWAAIRADAARGRTVVFATHCLEEADAYADRIILLRQGRIVADGSAAEIKNMAAGRTVTARIDHPDQAAVAGLDCVDAVGLQGGKISVHTESSDVVARYFQNETNAVDLEITSNNLQDAFMALTGQDAAAPAAGKGI